MGQLIQHLTTVLAALVIALVTSWSLTLLVLASIPVLLVLQAVSQALAMPRYDNERNFLARAAALTTTSLSAISTVKAFNAQSDTASRLGELLNRARRTAHTCSAIWGVTAGGTQFVLFAMFVQGFWFGSALVRKGTISPGQVMGVFWACLIAASNLQMCIPLIVTVSKGKSAAVAVAGVLNPVERVSRPGLEDGGDGAGLGGLRKQKSIPLLRAPTHRIPMRKITPARECKGEIGLHNVTFAYPSRPDQVRSPLFTLVCHINLIWPSLQIVLRDVSMFIPPHEMTFIIGGSGSGKSTVAQVMTGMYKVHSERARVQSGVRKSQADGGPAGFGYTSPGADVKSPNGFEPEVEDEAYRAQTPGGMIVLDDQQLDMLDERWTRKNVALVSQQCILFDMSIHDNVAIGLAGVSDGEGEE